MADDETPNSTGTPDEQADYDTPWKTMIQDYFEEFVAFYFPDVHKEIDWSRQPEFLDTQLARVVRDAELGNRFADRLVKVWRKSGAEAWVLTHVEVQGGREADFETRMFIYNYRIFDDCGRHVVSLAVLADDSSSWRPEVYHEELWGCETTFRFPTVKLLDWRGREDHLAQNPNVFAKATLAYLETRRTRRDPEARLMSRWSLMRALLEGGLSRQKVLSLVSFIDWVMVLPPALAQRLVTIVEKYEEEREMTYVTSYERIGEQKGLQKGLLSEAREALMDNVRLRFGQVPEAFAEKIAEIADIERLRALRKEAFTAGSQDDFEQALAS